MLSGPDQLHPVRLRRPSARPWAVSPSLSGIPPNCLTSMCTTRSPGESARSGVRAHTPDTVAGGQVGQMATGQDPAGCTAPIRCSRRSRPASSSTSTSEVWRGWWCGRTCPRRPAASSGRPSGLRWYDSWKRSAARRWPALVHNAAGQTQSLPVGVGGHGGWNTRDLLRSAVDVAVHTEPRRPSPVQTPSTRETQSPGTRPDECGGCHSRENPCSYGIGYPRFPLLWQAVEHAK